MRVHLLVHGRSGAGKTGTAFPVFEWRGAV